MPEVSEPMVRLSSRFCVRRKPGKPVNVSPCLTQEPPKEDLTVSEKFQLVLDVAQKAQVRGSF